MLIPKRYKRYKNMSRLEELANTLFGEMRDMTPEESKACRESISKTSNPTGVNFYDLMGIPPACRNCGNHPVNGGSGICHCTLGTTQVTC